MAEKKFFVDINLQGSALTNAKIGTNSGIGSTEGAFGYDSSAHRLQYFDGTATKEVANLSDIAAVTGGLIFQGGYDPTTNTPDITDGTAYKGFFWVATAAGTFLGESVQVGDSIVAKVDNASTNAADWLILQGNVVIATDSVDGISRLATQTEANDGTEAGAVVITPATLQGKIDAQITPQITSLNNDKLSRDGSQYMEGNLNMGGYGINHVASIGFIDGLPNAVVFTNDFSSDGTTKVTNLPTPTNGGDAANKTYVDDNTSNKLPLAGGTMTGNINFLGPAAITNLNAIEVDDISATDPSYTIFINNPLNFNDTNLPTGLTAPTNGTDATNKTYVDNAASTAESNANDYTDDAIAQEVTDRNAAIASKTYTQFISTSDWVLSDGLYSLDVIHGLQGFPVISAIESASGNYCEMQYKYLIDGTTKISSNILPSETIIVSFVNTLN